MSEDVSSPIEAPSLETIAGLETATDDEAAAVTAAIAAHLRTQELAAAAREDGSERSWDGDRWRFAGRLEAIGRSAGRTPRCAPKDPWTASGRTDRF